VKVYEPNIVGGEQRFIANIVSVQKRLIAFGELLASPGKALKFGTPIHTLLIHLTPGQTLFELNDQGNTRDTSDVERLELTPTTMRVVFVAGHGPYSGRVSLSPHIEIFDRDAHTPKQLGSVLVEARPTTTQLARIKEYLRTDRRLKLALPVEPKPPKAASKKRATSATGRLRGKKRP
jgi:hypothetical protein